MWTNNYNPNKSDWYVAKIEGKRTVLNWNAPNKFWSDFAGKTYEPECIDCWLDDENL